MVVEFKYSDNESATQLQTMRLLKNHPEVKEKISEGKLSLSQAADINRFLNTDTACDGEAIKNIIKEKKFNKIRSRKETCTC